jgi:S1-C subfamily serine protease
LGVRYLTIDEDLKEKMSLPVSYGALVVRESPHDPGVLPNGPAHKAGIRERDIILECNHEKVSRDHPIQDFLENMNVGDKLELLVLRAGKRFTVKVALAEHREVQ